jgi:hypothetical protein
MIVKIERPVDARLAGSHYRISNEDESVNVILPVSPLLRRLFRSYEYSIFYEVSVTEESEFVFEKKLKGRIW